MTASIPNNKTEIETVGWVSDPNGRGTVSLVTTCVLTLGVCVWSAMHLNIPPDGESAWKFWLRNIKWGLAGVFGPELVLFIAWKQYLSAKAIAKKSKELADAWRPASLTDQTREKTPVVKLPLNAYPDPKPYSWWTRNSRKEPYFTQTLAFSLGQ